MADSLFEIRKILDNCLSKLKSQKDLNVRLQRYEQLALLRDIERQLESMAEHSALAGHAIPAKGLTPKGRLFYNELFEYGKGRRWKEIPAHLQGLLAERKTQLNKQMQFDDISGSGLLKLNQQLNEQEAAINRFYNTIRYALPDRSRQTPAEQPETGRLLLRCFTQGNHYEFYPGSFDPKNHFYELEFSLTDLMESSPFYYKTAAQAVNAFNELPAALHRQGFCLMFALLANDGILAWQDFLNISEVTTSLNVSIDF